MEWYCTRQRRKECVRDDRFRRALLRDQWSIDSVFPYSPLFSFFIKFFMNRHNGSRSDRIVECTYCYTRATTSRNLMTLIPPVDEWSWVLSSSPMINGNTNDRGRRDHDKDIRIFIVRLKRLTRSGYDSKNSGCEQVHNEAGRKRTDVAISHLRISN